MEEERPAFGLAQLPVVLRAEDLSGCETDERSFLIVVGLAAVDHVAALHVFEEDGIDAEGAQRGADGSHFREVDDADERMQRRIVHQIVILFDTIQFQYVLHDRGILRPSQSYAFFRFLRDNRNNGKTIRDPYNGPEVPMRYFCSVGTEGVAGLAPEDDGTDRKNELFR